MSKQRATAGKRQRELNKQTKAATKRERRQRISDDAAVLPDEATVHSDGTTGPSAGRDRSGASDAELLDLIEALHVQFDSGQIDFEMFEVRKADLLARLQVD